MRTGRHPLLTQVHEMQGWRSHKTQAKQRAKEPQPEHEAPPMPPTLSDKAKPYWERFVGYLGPQGLDVLAVTDTPALEMLIEVYAEWQEHKQTVESGGRYGMLKTGNGGTRPVIHPAQRLMERSRAEFEKMLTHFGLSPLSRTRLHTIGDPKHGRSRRDSEIEKFFG